MELRVTNRNFSDDLNNPNSSAYLEFVEEFTEQVKEHGDGVDPTWGHDVPGCTSKCISWVLQVLVGRVSAWSSVGTLGCV